MTSSPKTYSLLTTPMSGGSASGLDQLVGLAQQDPGLAGRNPGAQVLGGARAADGLNKIIAAAARATGAAADGVFTATEVLAMNAWIRTNKLAEFTALHGDDENGVETGFHLIQGDGASTGYRGGNLVNTVMDGLYHIGFEVKDGRFLNEDGNANASVNSVAKWLTQFWTDRATTNTGLDTATLLIQADRGLACNIRDGDIFAGMAAANGINQIIADIVAAKNLLADRMISVADVKAINAAIRADSALLAKFTAFHGDDENGVETGFHRVQGDGASTVYFGRNLVDTVLDGIYHIGFATQNGRFLNEDGAQNATLRDVASWLDFFLADVSTTNTGLDRITDTIKLDRGLTENVAAADLMGGARAANGLNTLLMQGVTTLRLSADGWIGAEDLVALSAWVRADAARNQTFITYHGNDENGVETGFHLVQGDGGTVRYFGEKLIDTVADGIYHFGFAIENGRFLNEDGNQNAQLSDVSAWLNAFVMGAELIQGGGGGDTIRGTDAAEVLSGRGGRDTLLGGAGNDLLLGGEGSDALFGEAGNDQLYGGFGNDTQDGGAGSDRYLVMGSQARDFEGFDSYLDTGAAGLDRIVMVGSDVDLGLKGFSGIEVIDASGVTGRARIIGDGGADRFDFSATSFIGSIRIEAGGGDDTVRGSAGADVILGGAGRDILFGGLGNDILSGGSGDDIFAFARGFGQDHITDFQIGRDRLMLLDIPGGPDRIGIVNGQLVIGIGADTITIDNITSMRSLPSPDLLFV
jgi:Ca2+-binding RTX toxin-like protein